MTEYERSQFDETQQGVLGWLLSRSGAPGETERDARSVLDAGGLLLFDDEWACELWRRVEAALKDGKNPEVYRHKKQVEELDIAFVERIIDNGVSGPLVEHTYLPALIKAKRARQVKAAMVEAGNTGDTAHVAALLKEQPPAPGTKTLASMAARVVDEWQAASEHPGELSGIPSGLIDLDRLTWGWQKQNLIVIGARPSQGKTAILIGFARHAAIEKSVPTVIFSLESSGEEIVRRILCQMTGADQSRMRGGEAQERDIANLPAAMGKLRRAPLKIVDCPGASITWLRTEAKRLSESMGAKLFLVDYLQKIKPTQRHEKKTYEIAQASEGLKEMAVECDAPVITAAQVNREPEKAKGRAPQLSDLADSGQIERDADIVGLLHEKKGERALILAKFRDGPQGYVPLAFNPSCARFDNFAHIQREDVPNYDV